MSERSEKRLTVGRKEEEDLIAFLSTRLDLSRRAAKRILDERGVFVNDRRVWMARHRLQPGDEVEVRTAGTSPRSVEISILLETADALVVNKPAGRLSNEGDVSVEEELRRIRNEPGLCAVHRLDRDTSGCLWLARSEAAQNVAIEAFRGMRVRKVYEAIVLGRYPRERDLLSEPMEGREARTRVERLFATDRASRLRLTLETGRTHQIRKHLLTAGHPIAGDRTYGASRTMDPDFRALPRQMLHALELEANLGEGAVLRARAPLPDDYRAALLTLGLLPGPARAVSGRARPSPVRPQKREDRQKPRSSSRR
jgi:23S rRNA-/tRNA-specific pseudouridylate synthase